MRQETVNYVNSHITEAKVYGSIFNDTEDKRIKSAFNAMLKDIRKSGYSDMFKDALINSCKKAFNSQRH